MNGVKQHTKSKRHEHIGVLCVRHILRPDFIVLSLWLLHIHPPFFLFPFAVIEGYINKHEQLPHDDPECFMSGKHSDAGQTGTACSHGHQIIS